LMRNMESLDADGHMIYFIQDSATQAIKIGLAKKPRKRLSTLQTGNSQTLVIVGTIPGTAKDEALLHVKFAEHRLRGEWFKGEIIEGVLEIISSKREKVGGAKMNSDDTTGNVKGGDSAIQGACQIPGLKMKSLSMELKESKDDKNRAVECYVELKYVLEFEEDVTGQDLVQMRHTFEGSQTHPLKHVFLDEENVVIPFNTVLQCWVPQYAQSPITGLKGVGFRVLATGSTRFSSSANRSSSDLFYEGEHPLKKSKKACGSQSWITAGRRKALLQEPLDEGWRSLFLPLVAALRDLLEIVEALASEVFDDQQPVIYPEPE
jgi:hypothetical protein